ncbi:hypothetical protein RHMOL_Rhmol03G0056100 [Rhododendron molle]|uniref:Uncharacterized protein n=1 Tax=Rhododendron molle TaxID=49168 RepID=A0ACC0PCE7_RHOML|nr:hypothetical protein RHMOL_Rhmol03G0056100 [Rhododendron molle]
MLVDSKVPRTVILPFYCNKSYLLGNGILKTWLNLGEDGSISTCGTYHGDTIVHNENIEASKVGETRKLKGMWIHPRLWLPVVVVASSDGVARLLGLLPPPLLSLSEKKRSSFSASFLFINRWDPPPHSKVESTWLARKFPQTLRFLQELPGIVLALHPPFLPDIKLVNHCRVGELNRGGAVVEVNSVKRMQ